MDNERRYSEQEIADIFEQAAEAQKAAQHQLSRGEGLTIAELQQIGKEAGLTSEFIARAADQLDRQPVTVAVSPSRRYLGLPITVSRTVDLPGPLSDAAWERLVADLRETFQAAGKVEQDGSLRHWWNGNLHAFVEPTASGHRLRMHTLNEYWRSILTGSMVFLAMGLLFILTLVASGDFMVVWEKTIFMSIFAMAGLGGMGLSVYRLPRWVREREQQMETIAARAVELTSKVSAPSTQDPAMSGKVDLDTGGDQAVDSVSGRAHHRTRST